MKDSARRITFLLGAGSSIPAGMPSTETLTEIVLLGADMKTAKSVFRHTHSTYYLGYPNVPGEDCVPQVHGLLQILKGEVDRYYKTRHAANYENLYYLASQIHDSELREYDNPAVQPLIDKIQPAVQSLLVPDVNGDRTEWSLSDLAYETVHYIYDIVWRKLLSSTIDSSKLSLLTEAVQSGNPVDIFTLNHDTVIDECLRAAGVKNYADGFGEAINEVRYFSPEVYYTTGNSVRIFKLHGSINWFRYDMGIGIPLNEDYWHTVDPQGNLQWPLEARPVMLVGAFNKMLSYSEDIFAELQCQFLGCLKETDCLVSLRVQFR